MISSITNSVLLMRLLGIRASEKMFGRQGVHILMHPSSKSRTSYLKHQVSAFLQYNNFRIEILCIIQCLG